MCNGSESHDVVALLSSPDRDFLIRNNGDQVKIDSLKGKKLGLYFSASCCGPCRLFTPTLVEVYNELAPKGDLEIVFVSADEDDASFKSYFSLMPWLAIPFSDLGKREHLDGFFKVSGVPPLVPHLVIIGESGEVLSKDGTEIIREHGAEGYPFTSERIKELQEQEEAARRNQSLRSILVSESRDYVISLHGRKVPVSELEGGTVGLYFSLFRPCVDFNTKLVEVYEQLKTRSEKFEIVLISFDNEEETFQHSFGGMPWLALPFKDKSRKKLVRYFEVSTVPTLVVIGPDGKTLHQNVAEAIEDHGVQAYPFTPEKFAGLAEIKKAQEDTQTLESVLCLEDRDFVIGKDGTKILVSELAGKNILLYFSAHWCAPCRVFLPRFVEAYHKIKEKDDAFEVIFISSDRDQSSFGEFFSKMPWLALPFGDKRKASVSRKFKDIPPMVVALGSNGRTVTKEARELIMRYGADAYPFTSEHLKEIEAKYNKMAEELPRKVKHALHEEHELVLARRMVYTCDGCQKTGNIWSFYCAECDFDLHPKCAIEEKRGDNPRRRRGGARIQRRMDM